MTRPALLLLAMCLVAATAEPVAAQQSLAEAKDLYTAARYEEALAVLGRLKAATPAPVETALALEQYRAMCLLALNRRPEAEQAIEAIAGLDPFFQPAEDDAAPWIRAAFRDARRKVLPAALQRLYGRAKDAYDRKAMAEAEAAFTRVLRILDDPDLALDKSALGDMRMVATGFLDLSRAAAGAKPAAPAPSPASPTPPSLPMPSAAPPQGAEQPPAPATPASGDQPRIYDVSAKDVTPPLPLRRDLPAWPFAPRATPGTAVVVEVVVKENGTIDSAIVRQSAGSYYDQMVSQAARNWLYRPATKDGQPVRFRLLVKVVLASGGNESVGAPPAPRR